MGAWKEGIIDDFNDGANDEDGDDDGDKDGDDDGDDDGEEEGDEDGDADCELYEYVSNKDVRLTCLVVYSVSIADTDTKKNCFPKMSKVIKFINIIFIQLISMNKAELSY